MRHLLTVLLIGLCCVACGPTMQSRRAYVKNHDRPERIEETIIEEKVVIGMTKQDVKASWGHPLHVNESYHVGVGSGTQWCYAGQQCVYFEDGVVTGWN